jgi:hypothetical protein
MNAVLFFTIHVAADMIPFFNNETRLSRFFHFVGKNTAKEATAYN